MSISETLASRAKFSELRELLGSLHLVRSHIKVARESEQVCQAESIALMTEVAPNGESVSFEIDGVSHAAKLMTNKGSDSWDVAELVEWIKQNPNLWRKVSTTVFDPQKFEAEIAIGNVKKSDVERFVISGKESAPYIKFVNITPDSL